jgi:predicted nucleotidyltransferase
VTTSVLARCTWPPLPSPYDEALRDAVAFILREVDPVGIIATGTIVRGTPHESSDLDVFVIHGAPHRRRIQRFFHGVPAEIFINPASTVRRYFAEECRDGRPITANPGT